MTQTQTNYYHQYWRHRIKRGYTGNDLSPRIRIALKHLPPEQAASVLDIGCGDGMLGKNAKQKNSKLILTGTDIAAVAVNLAKKHYHQTATLDITAPAAGRQIPGRFDFITALEVIEHLVDPNRLLKFCFSHLKDDGKLILSFPNTGWWRYRWDLFFKGKFMAETPTFTDRDHLHFFTLPSITELLRRHGFWLETSDAVYNLPWYFGRLNEHCQRFLGKKWPGLFGYQIVLVCRKRTGRPVIAHLALDYLNPYETWLYAQIITQSRTQPIVLTRNLKNSGLFPWFGAVFKYPLLFEKAGQPRTFRRLVLKKILGLAQRLLDRFTRREINFYQNVLRRSGARLIYAHYGPAGYFALKLKQASGLPLIVAFCGSDAYWLPANQPAWKRKYRRLWREADAIIVRGPKMKQQLINLGCPKTKLKIIDHGVIIEQIPFKVRRNRPQVKLLTACNLIDYKGVDIVIKAFAKICAGFPRTSLTVIGNGPEAANLDRLISDLQLTKRVWRRPFMPLIQLIKESEKYQLFLHPSRTTANHKQEGSPTGIYERAAGGMPVIATRHSDIPQIVKDGRNGFLVAENNIDELAEKLQYLLRHPRLWERFGRFGRDLVVKKFNAVKQTAKREVLFLQLIAQTAADKYGQ